jgi:hypothetical protein
MSGSTSSPARSERPPTRCPPARPSSSGGASSSPGRCGEHATGPAGTGSLPPIPGAASQAVTGTLPGRSLRRAVLLSDGASRLVDLFELATWEELLALLDENGPEELLRQVRAAEAVDAEDRQWPRTKRMTTPPPCTWCSLTARPAPLGSERDDDPDHAVIERTHLGLPLNPLLGRHPVGAVHLQVLVRDGAGCRAAASSAPPPR